MYVNVCIHYDYITTTIIIIIIFEQHQLTQGITFKTNLSGIHTTRRRTAQYCSNRLHANQQHHSHRKQRCAVQRIGAENSERERLQQQIQRSAAQCSTVPRRTARSVNAALSAQCIASQRVM